MLLIRSPEHASSKTPFTISLRMVLYSCDNARMLSMANRLFTLSSVKGSSEDRLLHGAWPRLWHIGQSRLGPSGARSCRQPSVLPGGARLATRLLIHVPKQRMNRMSISVRISAASSLHTPTHGRHRGLWQGQAYDSATWLLRARVHSDHLPSSFPRAVDLIVTAPRVGRLVLGGIGHTGSRAFAFACLGQSEGLASWELGGGHANLCHLLRVLTSTHAYSVG